MNKYGIILTAILITGCNEVETSLDATKEQATTLVFTTGTSVLHTNRVVTDRSDIVRILSGIDVGRQTPYSRHPFKYQMIISTDGGTTIRLTFEKDIHGQYCSIRNAQKQFLLSEKSYDLLEKEMGIQPAGGAYVAPAAGAPSAHP